MNLSDFEQHAVDSVLKTRGAGKHAFRSSIRHLERAFELKDSMPEIAIFLGITCEEEAATAVFHALKKRRYIGAEKLSRKNHVHKLALHPFLLAIGRSFEEIFGNRKPTLEFNETLQADGAERLRVRFSVFDKNGKETWAYPLPPLHFTMKLNGELHRFSDELHSIASEKNAKRAHDYIRFLANRRNQAIYAAPQGIPYAEDVEKFLIYRKSVWFSFLVAYLLIEPYREIQEFVEQAVVAYLQLLCLVPDDAVQT
jgi:hypothetical protein